MARQYIEIQLTDMADFLSNQKFQYIQLDGTNEVVFARRFDWTTNPPLPLSMRVYTSIELNGGQRDSHEDAIRVALFAKLPNNKIVMINSGPRVQRIETWRKNLQARIDSMTVDHVCPECGNPMRLVEPKKAQTFKPFYGCVMAFITGCKGSAQA